MGTRVAVAGASGYAGGELLRLLAGHPDLEITAVSAGSSAGKPITSIHPNLAGHPAFDGKNFAATDAATLGEAELIFMALPHGESAEAGGRAAARTDRRPVRRLPARRRGGMAQVLRRRRRPRRAAGPTACPSCPVPGKAQRKENIRQARTVAAPGCYATTSILALAPLLAAGLAEPDDIVIVAASGTSGAGRSLRADLLASEVMGSMSAYKVGGTHRHTPEIEQALSEASGLDGDALLHPDARPDAPRHPRHLHGQAHRDGDGERRPGEQALRAALAAAYADSPFVHLLPDGPVAGHRRGVRVERRARTGRGRPARRAARSSSPPPTTSARARPARPCSSRT